RTEANSPQQALTLLNDPTFVEAARAWAAELVTSCEDDATRLDRAFERALARPIRSEEREHLRGLLATLRDHYRDEPDEADALLSVGIAPPPGPDADRAELAAWANVCRVILNRHETITRD